MTKTTPPQKIIPKITKKIIWILGDQLHPESNLIKAAKIENLFLLIESKAFASEHLHHKKKLIFQFSAMRHFAEELKEKNYKVKYVRFNDELGGKPFEEILQTVFEQEKEYKNLSVMQAADYDFQVLQKNLHKILPEIKTEILPNNLFISEVEDIEKQIKDKKHPLMENYYRHLRRKHKVLMEEDKPFGGKWNYDKENRKPLKTLPKGKANVAFNLAPDKTTQEVIKEVEKHFPKHYGVSEGFSFCVTRKEALKQLEGFCLHFLTSFGDYQDAMHTKDFYLYHSILSYCMNFGFLHPMEVIRKVEESFYKNPKIPINSVEGFIRQILGWREFIYCIYQSQMPKYRELNFFKNTRSMPDFMWTGETKMNCLQHSVRQTIEHAYAHHIQRLMVIGNFCLLAGINPQEVCEWYLVVYVDALEWVELPNTLGMSQFGDGGLFATKPYISSGNYINRMSNYCETCHYDVKKPIGGGACPFNYLYWNFLAEKYEVLKSNHRMGIALSNLARKTPEELQEIKRQSKKFLEESDEMKGYNPSSNL
ncbi:MAG: cryptochrome/photolyase family protein [Candidatus Caenarcaniphilales bacterium]|nr:cryptochrome/photolyase family protein [Candidatus Caenarcaniphilales bacterium]